MPSTIEDVRAVGTAPQTPVTYTFNYAYLNTSDAFPHLQSITNTINTPEAYTFQYTGGNLNSPFSPSTNYGQTYTLTGMTATPTATHYVFQYDTAGASELTRVNLPDGGAIAWAYSGSNYSDNRVLREANVRSLWQYSGGTAWNYWTTHDDSANPNATVHNTTMLTDASGPAKVWTFATSNTGTPGWQTGLATRLENRGSVNGASLKTDTYRWDVGPGDGDPFITATTEFDRLIWPTLAV